MQENSETTRDRQLDEELADVLIAISQKAADDKPRRRNAGWGK